LVEVCASCGAALPPGAGFCPTCGVAVTPADAGEERKLVTVVFADVTGSTSLGERLDPERFREVMQAYASAMRAEIEAEGGTVEKFIGDAVMAAFGVPAAHEDDAERALRAGLRMLRRLEVLNEELRARHDVAGCIGVNTGEAIAAAPAPPGSDCRRCGSARASCRRRGPGRSIPSARPGPRAVRVRGCGYGRLGQTGACRAFRAREAGRGRGPGFAAPMVTHLGRSPAARPAERGAWRRPPQTLYFTTPASASRDSPCLAAERAIPAAGPAKRRRRMETA
jgi:ribosomal protein L40E